ncbi:hypothetical protein BC831DRAFT_470969 [Entophlyctis helioformis]|nr:hypothetical protein BC831DRAFT_470969 [Entophlyctis helioformis]
MNVAPLATPFGVHFGRIVQDAFIQLAKLCKVDADMLRRLDALEIHSVLDIQRVLEQMWQDSHLDPLTLQHKNTAMHTATLSRLYEWCVDVAQQLKDDMGVSSGQQDDSGAIDADGHEQRLGNSPDGDGGAGHSGSVHLQASGEVAAASASAASDAESSRQQQQPQPGDSLQLDGPGAEAPEMHFTTRSGRRVARLPSTWTENGSQQRAAKAPKSRKGGTSSAKQGDAAHDSTGSSSQQALDTMPMDLSAQSVSLSDDGARVAQQEAAGAGTNGGGRVEHEPQSSNNVATLAVQTSKRSRPSRSAQSKDPSTKRRLAPARHRTLILDGENDDGNPGIYSAASPELASGRVPAAATTQAAAAAAGTSSPLPVAAQSAVMPLKATAAAKGKKPARQRMSRAAKQRDVILIDDTEGDGGGDGDGQRLVAMDTESDSNPKPGLSAPHIPVVQDATQSGNAERAGLPPQSRKSMRLSRKSS